MVPGAVWAWDEAKLAATVTRGARRITTPDHTPVMGGVQKLHHQVATRDPQLYQQILRDHPGAEANRQLYGAVDTARQMAPKDKGFRGAANAAKQTALTSNFEGLPARGARIPAQEGYHAFHEGFQAGQHGQHGEQLPVPISPHVPTGAPSSAAGTPRPASAAQAPAAHPAPAAAGAKGGLGWAPMAIGGGLIAAPLLAGALRPKEREERQDAA